MRKHFFILPLLVSCATDPATGRNKLEEFGHQLQCINGVCPPSENASYQDKVAWAKLVEERDRQNFNQSVYSASECTGPVVMGVCHGAIIPQSAYHPVCHGQMLNGQCTGPMF